MDKLEKDAKKKRTTNVYSDTYDNGGWSKRDVLPTGDPIGDVVESEQEPTTKKELKKYPKPMECKTAWAPPVGFEKDVQNYIDTMKDRLLVPKGKFLDGDFGVSFHTCCEKPQKYKNIISNSLKFWSCKNCGADLGDIK